MTKTKPFSRGDASIARRPAGFARSLARSQVCLPIGRWERFLEWSDGRSRVNGDIHARFWESAGVRFPRATHLSRLARERWHGSDSAAVRFSESERLHRKVCFVGQEQVPGADAPLR